MNDLMEHIVDLHGALPPFMTEFREMDALLNAEKPELETLFSAIRQALNDLFPDTASEAMIARYERITGARPMAGDSLQTRRLRVLLAYARVERFTIAALREAAAALGEDVEVRLQPGHRMLIDFLSGNDENIAILEEEFRESLPAHLEIIIRNIIKFSGPLRVGAALGLGLKYTFREDG